MDCYPLALLQDFSELLSNWELSKQLLLILIHI